MDATQLFNPLISSRRLRSILTQSPELIQIKDQNENTLLHTHSNRRIIHFLIQNKCDYRARNKEGLDALNYGDVFKREIIRAELCMFISNELRDRLLLLEHTYSYKQKMRLLMEFLNRVTYHLDFLLDYPQFNSILDNLKIHLRNLYHQRRIIWVKPYYEKIFMEPLERPHESIVLIGGLTAAALGIMGSMLYYIYTRSTNLN